MKISNRLLSISNLVNKDDIIADIGCDHALLDIYLVNNNVISSAYVSDINEGAINSGINNIKKYHLEEKITAKLSSGIESIPININTLIISGMGASTIIKILEHPNLEQINKIIIQSNNDHYKLRKTIIKKGFIIKEENIIEDNKKYYINIVFIRGTKKYSTKELKYGPILIKNNSKYFNYLYEKKYSIYKNIPLTNIKQKIRLIKELLEIRQYIK